MNEDLVYMLDNRLAPATEKQYRATFSHWEEECQKRGRLSIPADPLDVANFLATKAREQQSVASIMTIAAAIAHNYTKRFLPSPTEHKTVRLLLESVKKIFTKEATPKKIFTAELLDRARTRTAAAGQLWRWRTMWSMYASFYAMLQWDESSSIQTGDIQFSQWGMQLKIRRSKTDQAGEGAVVAVKRLKEDGRCPVKFTEQYIQKLQYDPTNSSAWMQPRIQNTKTGERGLPEYRLGYSNALSDLKRLLSEIGEDSSLKR